MAGIHATQPLVMELDAMSSVIHKHEIPLLQLISRVLHRLFQLVAHKVY